MNVEDGSARRFILVSSTEATEDQPDKNLCRDICAERVRRVLDGYRNAKSEQVEGLGGGFAYLRTRRIAPRRLPTRIAHAEAWHALQLIHDRALDRWAGHGFQHDGALGYLADFRAASIQALRAWLGDSRGAGHTLYSWTPERIADIAPEANLAPISGFPEKRGSGGEATPRHATVRACVQATVPSRTSGREHARSYVPPIVFARHSAAVRGRHKATVNTSRHSGAACGFITGRTRNLPLPCTHRKQIPDRRCAASGMTRGECGDLTPIRSGEA